MNIIDWNPTDGDALQGDVILFRLPDSIKLDTSDEIAARDNRLVLAEGEVTGHHHAIWLRNPPAMFRANEGDGGVIDTSALLATATKKPTKTKPGTAKLYRDPKALDTLVRAGELTDARLAIGILVIDGASMLLTHDEHDAIRIPPGRYYVGGQREWDAAEERRVQD